MPDDWMDPAWGPGRWFGRPRALAALARILAAGAPVALVGGPRIGKTSLLREAALETGAAAVLDASAGEAAAAVLAAIDAALERAAAHAEALDGRIALFLDDADRFASPAFAPVAERAAELAARGARGMPVSVVLAGSRPLWEAAAGLGLRLFPLSVWDRRQVGSYLRSIDPEAPAAGIAKILKHSGSHPFLLKGLLSRGFDLEAGRKAAAPRFEEAFRLWHAQMAPRGGSGRAAIDARPLMSWLVAHGAPVAWDRARRALGRPALKEEADLLVWLGVVERRLRGEDAVATVHAGCGLFNDWYRRREWSRGGGTADGA